MGGQISADLLRGHTDTIVLSILLQNDNYGYGIYKKIIEKSTGLYEVKEATLYSSFRRQGRKQYVTNKKDWEFVKIIIDKLI